MATEPETPPAEEEYVKPDPAKNPRNIALAEIAKTVAKQHEIEFSETADSIDDDGNITPAKPAEAAPPAEEQPLEQPPSETPPAEAAPQPPEEPAPAKAPAAPSQDAVDPEKEYEVTVDGQKMRVKGKAIIDAGFRTFQKETAADYRLKVATELLDEAEKRMRGATPPGAPPADATPKGRTDLEIAHDLQYGTAEQAAAALAELGKRNVVTPEQVQAFASQQARLAAQDEYQFQEAKKFVENEYGDLLSNDYMRRLFFTEESRRRAPKERGGEGDRRPYREVYQTIGEDLRKAFNMPKKAAPSQSAPTPSGTAAARQERKAATPPVPRTAATRLAEAADQAKAKTPSEIIAEMAAKRGKSQLSTLRKGP